MVLGNNKNNVITQIWGDNKNSTDILGNSENDTNILDNNKNNTDILGNNKNNTDWNGLPDQPLPSVDEKYCRYLELTRGFWSTLQWQLWTHIIEADVSLDLGSYIASNIPPEERFWSSNLSQHPTASGPNGRIVYHLHLHECMGSTFCSWFRRARPSALVKGKTRKAWRPTNNRDNCNVPDTYWWNESAPDLHYQFGAYIGSNRRMMRTVYEKIRRQGWIYVATEGSLSDEPIFGSGGPYYHSTILREPVSWTVCMFHYETITTKMSFDEYLTTKLWGVPDFFTRRICGSNCVHNDPLTVRDFMEAKSRLDLFDLVMAQDLIENATSTKLVLQKEFPALTFPPIERRENVGAYSGSELTQFQLEFIHNKSVLDMVL